jgi:DNA-binding transcriptional regulator LsrR (DeoR family)
MIERPATGRSEGDLAKAAMAARLYYLERRSKLEIAEELGVNRFKVARLLERAHSSGLVHIEIRDPEGVDAALSERLADALGIERAIVLAVATDLMSQIGALAARYLADVIQPEATVGIAWSRSTQALVEHLAPAPPCTVVQLCGVITQAEGEEQNVELVRRAARTLGARPMTFYAPLVVSEPAVATALKRQAGIAEALRACDHLDVAVIAVGQWEPGESTVHDALSPAEQAVFAKRGAVAESAGMLFSSTGKRLRHGLQDRVIAVNEQQLRKAGDVVALASDQGRARAVRALTRSGMISTLITHRALAEELLHSTA